MKAEQSLIHDLRGDIGILIVVGDDTSESSAHKSIRTLPLQVQHTSVLISDILIEWLRRSLSARSKITITVGTGSGGSRNRRRLDLQRSSGSGRCGMEISPDLKELLGLFRSH